CIRVDTWPSRAVAAACNGCDILIHEVYSDTGFAKRTPEWQRYHSRYHTSASELAKIATEARPGLLVLYHQLLWSASKDDLMREVEAGYKGKVVFGNDLDVF